MAPRKQGSPETQRAYTVRLKAESESAMEALWETHEAINKGAKVFGDWLLTFRGGVPYELADKKPKKLKDGIKWEDLRRRRRVMIALSWMSVESKEGAPLKYLVASADDADRGEKVKDAFRRALERRGMKPEDIEAWLEDCGKTLEARIRDDAVWVDRSRAFDDLARQLEEQGEDDVKGDMIWDLLWMEKKDAYLPVSLDAEALSGGKQFNQMARGWLSKRYGTGKGADFSQIKKGYLSIRRWLEKESEKYEGCSGKEVLESLAEYLKVEPTVDAVTKLIRRSGRGDRLLGALKGLESLKRFRRENREGWLVYCDKALKKLGTKVIKGPRIYSDILLKILEKETGLSYYLPDKKTGKMTNKGREQYCVMLDMALRRVSVHHSWSHRAEATRAEAENDLKLLQEIPVEAFEWLEDYRRRRGWLLGNREEFALALRALKGWADVVEEWAKGGDDAETRREMVRRIQGDMEDFGDVNLFYDMAAEDAVPVWRRDGKPDANILKNYVKVVRAEREMRRFKVPAYRHPDPYNHPIFCEFGNSRPPVVFGILERVKNRQAEKLDDRRLSLQLKWGDGLRDFGFHWMSKRLREDLGLQPGRVSVSVDQMPRADRFGRAVAHQASDAVVMPTKFLEKAEANARLQADRAALASLGRLVKTFGPNDKRTLEACDSLNWFLSVTVPMEPFGPWNGYATECASKLSTSAPAVPSSGGGVVFNDGLQRNAGILHLSRLPGLRILSVDLGLRYGAACAVWETLSADAMAQACRGSGRPAPSPGEMYIHLKRTENGKERTVVYRRIAADEMVDKNGKRIAHPAPWARLDRQFLIRLDGEEKVRLASDEEIWRLHLLESSLGLRVPFLDRLERSGWFSAGGEGRRRRREALIRLGWNPLQGEKSLDTEDDRPKGGLSISIDSVLLEGVETLGEAVRRHGQKANIAWAMQADHKVLPGGRRYFFDRPEEASAGEDGSVRRTKHVQFLADALARWARLCRSRRWSDAEALRRMAEEVLSGLEGWGEFSTLLTESPTRGSKKRKEAEQGACQRLAAVLLERSDIRNRVHQRMSRMWEDETKRLRQAVKTMKRWIFPKLSSGTKEAGSEAEGRVPFGQLKYRGGLSLNRIALMQEFRRVQLSWWTSLRPDGSKREAAKGFSNAVLRRMEHLRDQRVKQLASRIVEAALGLGNEHSARQAGGKRSASPPDDPRFAPCHAVVVENLEQYKPDETRRRQENRQLMAWSARNLYKRLAEECELYGLCLHQVKAAYTSRQDSRTGAPGVRVDLVTKEEWEMGFWKRQVEKAREAVQSGKAKARDRYLVDLAEVMGRAGPGAWAAVPVEGGEWFVSAVGTGDGSSRKSPPLLQADLNAAANIGLRALTDPDWTGAWWYVPCSWKADGSFQVQVKVNKQKRKGETRRNQEGQTQGGGISLLFHGKAVFLEAASGSNPKDPKKEKSDKKIVNLWRDPVSADSLPTAGWMLWDDYRESVIGRVTERLRGFPPFSVTEEPF